MRPLPLADALDIIFRCDAHALERTSWALQKLTQKKVPREAQVQALQAIRQAAMPALARACGTDAKGGTRSLADVSARFQTANKAGSCTFDIGECKTEYDTASGTVHLKSVSIVHKPIEQCLKMLDPRNWGRCSPYFDPDNTYEIQTDAHRRPVRDRNGELVRGSSSAMGEPWNGLLRERFDGEGVATENILAIDFAIRKRQRRITRAEMQYSLYSCEYCQLGALAERAGLRKNSGGMTAERAGSNGASTKVTVTKHVRYKDFTPGNPGRFFDLGETLTLWASVLLCARADSEAVFNLCCDPESA
jgi:hypothetical protein